MRNAVKRPRLRLLLGAMLGLLTVLGLFRTGVIQLAMAAGLNSWSKTYFNPGEYLATPNCDGRAQCASGLITAMSFNVLCGLCDRAHFEQFGKRLPHLVDIIRRRDPDLLGLQEVAGENELKEVLAALPRYRAVTYRFGDWADADSALLYRKDLFEALDSGQMWLTPRPGLPFASAWEPLSIPRYVNWVYLRRKSNGFRFLYLNTHFDNHRLNKEMSADLFSTVVNLLSDHVPMVISGDFNLDSRSRWFTRLVSGISGGPLCEDAAALASRRVVADDDASGNTSAGKSFYTDPDHAIDHILLAGPGRRDVYQWQEDLPVYGPANRRPSDHPSVYAAFDLTLRD